MEIVKVWTEFNEFVKKCGEAVVDIYTRINTLELNVIRDADYGSTEKSNKDPETGLYLKKTVLRADGTLLKEELLTYSEENVNEEGNQDLLTIIIYARDGVTVRDTKRYKLTYDTTGDVVSRVLLND